MNASAPDPGSTFSPFASSSGDNIDLMHYVRLLFAHKWKLIFSPIIAAVIAAIIVQPMRQIYSAETTVLIETGQNALSSEDVFGDSRARGYLATQYGILRSRAFVEKVVDRLGLIYHPEFDPRQAVETKNLFQVGWERVFPPEPEEPIQLSEEETIAYERFIREAIVFRVRAGLAVLPQGGTQLVRLRMQSHDPVLAAAIVNELAEVYVESYLEARLSAAKKSASWLSGRLGELQDNLRVAENQLLEFRETENLVDVQGITTLDAAELAQMRSSFVSIRQSRLDAETLYQDVSRFSSGSLLGLLDLPSIAENNSIISLVDAKQRADKAVRDLSRTYGSLHPLMVSAVGEQKKSERNLINRLNIITKRIQDQYEQALLRENDVANEIKVLESRLQNLGRKEVRLQELERKVEASRQVYELFLSRGKEADEAIQFERAPARVIDVALPPRASEGPNKMKYIMAAAVAVGGLIAGIVLLMDILDSTIRVPDEVESQLSLPLLGFLPQVRGRAAKKLNQPFHDELSDKRFSESVRTIRTSLVLSNIDDPIKTILITSSLPNEGKSTLATNMAFALGQMEKVLLIDADMRNPSVGGLLGFPDDQPGLAEIAAGKLELNDVVQTLGPEKNVDVLTSGVLPSRPLELISSAQFKTFLNKVSSIYDRVVIDSPPASIVSDSKVLSRQSDAVVYVVCANSTSKSVVTKGVQSLKKIDAPLIGVVLNKVDMKKASIYEPEYAEYGKKNLYGY